MGSWYWIGVCAGLGVAVGVLLAGVLTGTRAALAAVKRWRFQPVNAPITTRRTIGFNPGG